MMRLHTPIMGESQLNKQNRNQKKAYPMTAVCVSADYDDAAAASEPDLAFPSIIASSSASFSESNMRRVSGSVYNFLSSFVFTSASIRTDQHIHSCASGFNAHKIADSLSLLVMPCHADRITYASTDLYALWFLFLGYAASIPGCRRRHAFAFPSTLPLPCPI